MKLLRILTLTVSLLALMEGAKAQQWSEKLYNMTVNDEPISDVFRRLEMQVEGLKIYYDPVQTDSLRVSFTVSGGTIATMLDSSLRNTNLFFSITEDKQVFITQGQKIATVLPPGIFGTSEDLTGRSPADTLFTDFSLQAQKKSFTRAENRLYELGAKTGTLPAQAIITGYVRNVATGEPLGNVSLFTDNEHSTVTDAYGYYSLTLPGGNNILNAQAIGMKDAQFQILVYGNSNFNMGLDETVTTLKEVIVSAKKLRNISSVQMGVERLNIEEIKRVPTVFGESDVLRVVTSLPGVKTVGEASTGFNVRGGAADQNLILFNDATVFNPTHFFGLFSAFNPEIVQDLELYKSSVPAKYGGRLASVLEISSREGNKKEFKGSAGIGLITSRLNIEGPLVKDKTSFILGGRTTYANWMMQFLPKEYKNSRAAFQDINLGISHQIDSTDDIYVTGYYSRDRFTLDADTNYGYTNRNLNVKWKHIYSRKLNSVLTLAADQYDYRIRSEENKVNAFQLGFGINQISGKLDFVNYLNSKHSFDFGVSRIQYTLEPGSYRPVGSGSLVAENVVPEEYANENAIYVSHRFTPVPQLSISTGLRYSLFNNTGPGQVNMYAPGQPASEASLIDTRSYGKGEKIKSYGGPEYRISARYSVTSSFSVKGSFNTQRQYIHVLSNTTILAPTDIWKLSDYNIKPQNGSQFSLGFYKNLKSNTIEVSLEGYYKKIYDYLDYLPGAKLLLNQDIEQDVINTDGKAYGAELLIKRNSGKLNGWISYTWSRVLLRSSGDNGQYQVNQGAYYPANYDKPNDITLVANFEVNHRFSLSLNSTYSTGRPITLPVGRYYYSGSERVLYSNRNEYRIPDYIRTDFSLNVDGNHRVNQKTHNSWAFGVYNLLGRRNPYSVYFISEGGRVQGYRFSIFGNAIPFVNYNIRF